jgi:uncharacterized protein involved in outer membrane biogenesis
MRRFLRPIPLAVSALSVLCIYTLVGFFLVPYIIKAYVLPKVSEQLRRPVLVKEVEFNPYVLSLKLTEFEIQEPDSTPLIGFQEFFINFQTSSVFHRAYVFDQIRFAVPFASVKVKKDGHVNLADLVPPADPAAPPPPAKDADQPASLPAIQIGRFEIAQGIVEFRDESKARPVSLDIVPINLILKNFHTKPGGDNTYAFVAELGKNEVLDWKGTVSLEPIHSEGTLSLSGVKLARLFKHVQERFNFDIPTGTIQATGQYRFDAATSPIDLELSDTALHFADIGLAEKGDSTPVITVPTLNLDGIHVDLRERNVSVESIAMSDATNRVWRNSDGSLNLQTLFTPVNVQSGDGEPPSSPKLAASSTNETRPWTVSISQAAITNHTIHFEDRSLALPMRTDVTHLSGKTHDFVFPFKKPIPLTLEYKLNETGAVLVDGQIVAKPLQLEMEVALGNIAIQPFQPYFEQFARIAVDNGAIDLDGKLHLAVEHPKAPLMTFQGNLGVKSLAIADRDQGNPIASWKQFQLRDIALAVDPTSISIEEVGVNQPTVHLVVSPEGEINLKKILATQPSPARQKASTQPKKSPAPSITIKTVKVLRGTATFEDESITPPVQTGLYDLTGTVKGLSSKQLAKADVDLSGKIDKVAPLKIAGVINPLTEDAFTDLKIKFDNVDLTTATPYSGKYVGYPIQKGKLFLDLAYKVSQKQLEAENKVEVDQLTFGEKTDSPDATSLPVPLAVALLKDRQGRIDIDLPIRGDLKDPDFKYGKAVFATLGNILTKMVASPFALIGKLAPGGGNGEELQQLVFEPGSTVITPSEMKKIDALMRGLEERPGLRLEITGTADPARDRQAVALQKFHEQLQSMWRQKNGSSQAVDIPAQEEERLITELFDQWRSEQPMPLQPADTPVKPPTVEEMKRELVKTIPVDEGALRALARTRAEQVHSQMVGDGKLPEERVFMTDVDLSTSAQDKVPSRLNITAGS